MTEHFLVARIDWLYGMILNNSNLEQVQVLAKGIVSSGAGKEDEVILIMANANPDHLEDAVFNAEAVIFSRLLKKHGGKCRNCKFIDWEEYMQDPFNITCEEGIFIELRDDDFGCIHWQWNGEVAK